jgi:hypothetical protein
LKTENDEIKNIFYTNQASSQEKIRNLQEKNEELSESLKNIEEKYEKLKTKKKF